jgi:hypothetical protein
MQVDPIIPLAARAAFIALFAAAMVHKLRAWGSFSAAVRGYAALVGEAAATSGTFVAALGRAVLVIEAGLVALLLAPVLPHWQAAACAAVLLGYAALMGWSIARGHRIDCGCSFGATRQRVGRGAVLRNMGLAIAATLMLLPPNARSLTASDFASVAALLAITALVYQVVNQLLANAGTLPRSS